MSSAPFSIDVIQHDTLRSSDLDDLRALFDAEYFESFGPWSPDLPFGYAGHDVHVIARSEEGIVGHVGWARRSISVGAAEVTIAGVGGVLVSQRARGARLGFRLMGRAAESMSEAGDIDFGYLGCREEVVAFYVSCGWHRISAAERSISRHGEPVVESAGPSLLLLPVGRSLASWPSGAIDLRGRPW